MESTISLCLIAKNESDNIGRCLKSVEGFVDEIVLVDTGSTDNTIEIAVAAGAKVIEAEWKNDFSHARNISLENATGDWVLFLDCDEELSPESGPELRRVTRDTLFEAYFVIVTNLTQAGIELSFPSIRLFRNRKCYRFSGSIHEQIVKSIVNNSGIERIGHSKITVIHHGYNSDTTNIQAKIRRNLEILRTYTDEEKDGFYFYNLGTEHLRLGEREKALANFTEALRLTRPTQNYGPILVKRTMTTLMELRRYRDAVEQLRYYQTVYREFNDLVLLEAVCHLDCGRYSEAGLHLQRFLKMPPSPAWYPVEKIRDSTADDLLNRAEALAIPRDYPDISVCIIGRNEEDLIMHCIKSVNEIAKEVIFVDTGSDNKTPAIAHQLGADLYSFPWNGSFSDARNFGLSKARGEWILVLDADEALPDESRKMITDMVRDGRHEGYLLKICTYLDRSLSPANCQVQGACRLFRNKNYRYRGAVLEDITRSIRESGHRIGCAEITVNHFHYLAGDEEIARKRSVKTAAIEKGLAADPARRNFALGVEAFYKQDFASAVKHFENVSENLEEADRSSYYYFYALAALNTGHLSRAAEISERALTLFPDYTDLVYTQAVARFILGEIERAEPLLNRCLEMGDAPWEKYLASPGTGGFKALCSLGTLYARRGESDRALKTFAEAAGIPGAFEQAVESIAFLQDQLPTSLERFLEEHGILNSRSLSVASRCLAKMGRYKESLNYLALAAERIAGEPAPRDFARITQAIDFLIKRFHGQVSQKLPEDSRFRSCLIV
ncbi:MAG: glycosyltransferase [Bacillota bacterium]